MNASNLIPTDDLTGCPFPFFGYPVQQPKKVYKIYNDGGHFIATPVLRKTTRKLQDLPPKRYKTDEYTDEQKATVFRRIMRDKKKQVDENGNKRDKNAVDKIDLSRDNGAHCSRTALDILFDSLYFTAYKQGLKDNKLDKPMTDFIRAGILKLYPDMDKLDEYITDKIKRKLNNLLHRKKRFRRKANLNRWNYFVTFTYDDTKHTAESLKRNCVSAFQICILAGVGNIWAYSSKPPKRGVCTFTDLYMYLRGKCSERLRKSKIMIQLIIECKQGRKINFLPTISA